MKYIIGLSSINRDSTVSLITTDGHLEAVVAEDRFTRVKQQGGFPHRGMRYLINQFDLDREDIESVCYSFLDWQGERDAIEASARLDASRRNGIFDPLGSYLHKKGYARWNEAAVRHQKAYNDELIEGLREYGLDDRLRFYHHHYCHATTAYYMSGFDECLVASLDWYGSGLSGQIYVGRGGKLEAVKDVPMPNSLGMFYAQVTGSLGFRVSRHEGKVLGLAAYGKETPLYHWLKKRVYVDGDDIRFPHGFANAYYTRLQTRLFKREDMAYAYQRILEETTTAWVSHFVRKYGISKVALVGGVAANVKNNQRVNEIPGVESVFVQPDMGDGGAGLGAALGRAAELGPVPVRRIESIYMGPSYSDDEIEKALRDSGLVYQRCDDVERDIAALVAGDEIVARYNGGMEFGPRALGNRTIIAPATDPSINKSLNDRLRRTEFMPFAPATNIEDVDLCYRDAQGSLYTAEFMTITFNVTPLMQEKCPAAVHVDGTARPQVVTMERNPSFYRVIEHYKQMTGIPSVINTSFNMHEEPIVCSPQDAIRGFLQGKLDNLALGPFLVKLGDNEDVAAGERPAALLEDTQHESAW